MGIGELTKVRLATETEGLEKLLQSLVQSRSLGLKEKRKKLLQFEQTHPDIFRRLFPTHEHLEVILEQQKNYKNKRQPSAPIKEQFLPQQPQPSSRGRADSG